MEGKFKSNKSWKKVLRTVGNAYDYGVKIQKKSLLFLGPAYCKMYVSTSSEGKEAAGKLMQALMRKTYAHMEC